MRKSTYPTVRRLPGREQSHVPKGGAELGTAAPRASSKSSLRGDPSNSPSPDTPPWLHGRVSGHRTGRAASLWIALPQPRLGIRRPSLALEGRGHTSAAAMYFDLERTLCSPGMPLQLWNLEVAVNLGLQERASFHFPKDGSWPEWERGKVVWSGQVPGRPGKASSGSELAQKLAHAMGGSWVCWPSAPEQPCQPWMLGFCSTLRKDTKESCSSLAWGQGSFMAPRGCSQ